MQFQVPQFIEAEDKIVGPLSLREFMYIGIAGAVCLILYFMVNQTFWIIAAPLLMGAGIALAFIKINTRSLPDVVRTALAFYWRPQTYIWQPEGAITDKEGQLRALVGKKIVLPETRAVTKMTRAPKKELSLEQIITGFALKNAWHALYAGTSPSKISPHTYEERYEIYQRLSGDQRAAKRIDYTE